MTEHQLHNARTVRAPHSVPEGTPVPVCSQCDTPLHLVPLEGIRTGTRTWCSDACYRVFIDEAAAQAVRDHVASSAYQGALEHRTPPGSYTPPRPVKSTARHVAEGAANVVGFLIWLAVVSVIAVVIAAVFGIDSMR